MATATAKKPAPSATANAKKTKDATARKVAEAIAPSKLGEIVDEMFDLREQKRKLDAEVAQISALYAEKETLLMARLEDEKTDKAAGKKATVSITTSIVGDVEDWSAVEAFVKKTGNFQLFQRRIADAAYRELLESLKGKPVPGIKEFHKKRVNLRVIP